MTSALVRTCQGTRKNGQPCRSTIVGEDGHCFVHGPSASLLPEIARKAGLRSGEVRREQAKSVRDRLRDKVEAEADEVWRVYREAFDATGDDGDADHRARLASVEGVLAQAYGRPAVAITGDADAPLTFVLQSAFAERRNGGAA